MVSLCHSVNFLIIDKIIVYWMQFIAVERMWKTLLTRRLSFLWRAMLGEVDKNHSSASVRSEKVQSLFHRIIQHSACQRIDACTEEVLIREFSSSYSTILSIFSLGNVSGG